MTAWRVERREVKGIGRIDPEELYALRQSDGAIQILDVRELDEWRRVRIAGSVHVPYHDIHAVPDGIDPERPVAAICSSGQRSAVAASLLARFGVEQVLHVVDGGVGTWERAGHPVERGA